MDILDKKVYNDLSYPANSYILGKKRKEIK